MHIKATLATNTTFNTHTLKAGHQSVFFLFCCLILCGIRLATHANTHAHTQASRCLLVQIFLQPKRWYRAKVMLNVPCPRNVMLRCLPQQIKNKMKQQNKKWKKKNENFVYYYDYSQGHTCFCYFLFGFVCTVLRIVGWIEWLDGCMLDDIVVLVFRATQSLVTKLY